MIITTIILLMIGWLVYTVKATKRLYKLSLIISSSRLLMVADMIMAQYVNFPVFCRHLLAFAVEKEDFAICDIHVQGFFNLLLFYCA